MNFERAVCLVTGAASGLGRGITLELLHRGARVVALDRDEARLKTLVEEATGHRSRLETKITDVTAPRGPQEAIDACVATWGRIDALFNNAGIGGTLPFADATDDQWRAIVELNLMGVVHGTRAAYPHMVSQGSGLIVNTSSIAGLVPYPGQVLYNTTKFAVTGFSLTLADEARRQGIEVAVFCPGMVRTRIFYKPILGQEAREEDVEVPPEAISVNQAVDDLFRGLKKKNRVIITPGWLGWWYLRYRLFGSL